MIVLEVYELTSGEESNLVLEDSHECWAEGSSRARPKADRRRSDWTDCKVATSS